MEDSKKLVTDKRAKELADAESKVDGVELTSLEKNMLLEDANEDEADELLMSELDKKKNAAAVEYAKSLVNQETPSKLLNERPAWGVSGAKAEIHMRQTFALLLGRRGDKPITGLYEFAAKVKKVLSAYRKGCPFAAQLLLNIERDLDQTNELYVVKEADIKKLVKEASKLKMDRFTSRSPAEIEVIFASPYSYHALNLMLRFDDVVRILMPYYQSRLIDKAVYYQNVQELGRHLRRILSRCDGYFFVGKESTFKQDDVYQAAVNIFGELEDGIVEGKLLPYLVSVPQSFVTK